MSGSANFADSDRVRAKSRAIHGHMYVLPVAAWILDSEVTVAGVSEAMVGLDGRTDRPRIIEALVKLAEMGALREMPRGGLPRNAPRMFERIKSPYWAFAAAEVHEAEDGVFPGEMEVVHGG